MGDDTERVRELWKTWNAGERRFDMERVDPEVEIHSHVTQTIYRGFDGMDTWATEIDEQFDHWRVDIDDAWVDDDGRVVATGCIRGRGRQSGVDLDEPATWIVELRDSRLLRLENYIGSAAVERASRSRD